ncbi:AMP-dependent synthetase/ligase [Flammeovirga agarivorans]|uniref:Long-chain fatty acid--CoA ligase n=1 Tax=Flammeovirga agarivorans TaxID=2726742 RepID=A0A7X8SR12_9BACT|nr:long-chain fatty acid--CoA ligase [Flammeovirga agarivorans]NLR94704.1 long-chain fatty acid--CoA ligase [Flammeovirga agarivorans]
MEPKRVFDFIDQQKENYGGLNVCFANKENGNWITYSTEKISELLDQLGSGLLRYGLKKGDKIAIVSDNRPEWNFIDLACAQIGVTVVPIYPTITPDDYIFIFNHAEIKVAFIETKALSNKINKIKDQLPLLEQVYTFNQIDGEIHWSSLVDVTISEQESINQIKDEISEDDLYTIVYTSGTTGNPKGVMLSHKNVVSDAIAAAETLPVTRGNAKALSFLPLSHVYERTSVYSYICGGVSVYYAENVAKVAENLKEVQPDVFCTVPRLLEKVYDTIVSKGMETKGLKRAIFFWALNLGLKYNPREKMGLWFNIQHAIADKLVFKKWREALGGNIKNMNVGAAALQPRLIRSFWAAGIKVCEGYGMSETAPVVCVNRVNPEDMMVGTVGLPLNGVELKIASDGEILIKGPNVMLGYFKQPDLTAKTIKEGWLHSGDIGELVDGKFLKITDRKKELFKTSAGKYISPQFLENKLKESFFIEQVAVVGNHQKFPAALIVPNYDALEKWCEENHIFDTAPQNIIQNPEVLKKFKREVMQANKDFARYEQVQKFKLLENEWTIDTGEVTPTLKPKRKIINEKYKHLIDEIYT